MAEEKELVAIVPKNEYQPDLEAEVAIHLARVQAMNPFMVTKKLERIVIPEFKANERRDQLDWEMQQIKNCIDGVDVPGVGYVPGRYWFFYQFVNIKHKSRGKIRPDFRSKQLEWNKVKERISQTPGAGIVQYKRRQIGLSWDMAADNIYDCTFKNDFDIGMNSKSETDSRNFFTKHKYIHRNLPQFLRAHVSTDRRDAMFFGEWNKKSQQYIGTQSSIISVAPTPAGHAGNQYRKLVMDEAGETEIIPIWANAEDCIMQDGIRVGQPYIFGTVGDTNKVGRDLLEFWKNHDKYGLEQYAFHGYDCLLVDEFGNNNLAESIRYIIYARKQKEGGSQYIYNKFLQKYPLNEADAFLDASGGGVGDTIKLGKQRLHLFDNPPVRITGWMRPTANPAKPDFVPDPNGEIIIYEKPDHNRSHGYIATCDPAEDDNVERSKDASDLATVILAKPYGSEPPKLAVEVCYRPNKLHSYYEQVAMLLQWYNNTQLVVELNKGGWRLVDFFEQHFKHLLALTPASANSVYGGVQRSYGVKMTNERKTQMKSLIIDYVDNYCQFIPSIKLIDQFGVFGEKHKADDLGVAFGWALAILQGDKVAAKNLMDSINRNPTVNYVKQNGILQLSTGGQPQSTPQKKSALFRF